VPRRFKHAQTQERAHRRPDDAQDRPAQRLARLPAHDHVAGEGRPRDMGGPGPVGQRNRQKNGSDAFGLVDQTRREGIGRRSIRHGNQAKASREKVGTGFSTGAMRQAT
jgi:hypothetical protein